MQKKGELALLLAEHGQLRVARVSEGAAARGVRAGMPQTLARAYCPRLRFAALNTNRDFKALYKLALRAIAFTPLVAVETELVRAYQKKELNSVPPIYNGLILDISGTGRIHRSERQLAHKILQKLLGHGINARIGIGPNVATAWALSRYSEEPVYIVPPEEPFLKAVEDLPVAALRISESALEALGEIGIYNIKELLALPRKSISKRFGQSTLLRVEQLLGRLDEPLYMTKPRLLACAERTFELPIQRTAALEKVVVELLIDVLSQLKLHSKKAAMFSLRLYPAESADVIEKTVVLFSALKEFSRVVDILRPLTEKVFTKDGIEKVELSATHTEQLLFSQPQLLNDAESDAHLQKQRVEDLLNQLITRNSEDRVCLSSFKPSYFPEKSFVYSSVRFPQRYRASNTSKYLQPSYLLKNPEELNVLAILPDSPPHRVIWRNTTLKIVSATAMNRVQGEWWNSRNLEERDYFSLQDQHGRWLWAFRSNLSNRWFVHGVWA